MKVLIIGGGGNIGFWVEKLFSENNHYVCSLSRGTYKTKRSHPDNQTNFSFIREDINALSESSMRSITNYDVVIDFICYDAIDAQMRLKLFSKFSGLFVMVSTVAVYDRSPGMNVLSAQSSCYNTQWGYAKRKLDAERVLLAGMPIGQLKICRFGHTFDISLPVPFGVGDWTIIQWLLDGNPLMLCKGSESSWPLLHSRDAARRLLMMATEPRQFGTILNIVNWKVSSWFEIGETLFSTLRIPKAFRLLDVDDLKNTCPYWSESVVFHKQFDETYVGDEIEIFSDLKGDDWSLTTGLSVSLSFYFAEESFQIVNQSDYLQYSLLAKKSRAFRDQN